MCVLAVNSLELTERKSLRKNDTSQWFEQTQRALRMKLTRHAENLKSKQSFHFLLALIALWVTRKLQLQQFNSSISHSLIWLVECSRSILWLVLSSSLSSCRCWWWSSFVGGCKKCRLNFPEWNSHRPCSPVQPNPVTIFFFKQCLKWFKIYLLKRSYLIFFIFQFQSFFKTK